MLDLPWKNAMNSAHKWLSINFGYKEKHAINAHATN